MYVSSFRPSLKKYGGTHLNRVLLGLAMTGIVVAATAAHAAAPVLHQTKTVEIAAPPAKVWGIIDQFSDLTWVPPVKTSTATEGNTVGSVRTLDLGGPRLIEQLKAYDAKAMTYTYVITNDPANVKTLPVTDYTSTITVQPSATGSLVTWTGTFKRADQGDAPAADMDDKTATGAIGGVYEAGLGGLKVKATKS